MARRKKPETEATTESVVLEPMTPEVLSETTPEAPVSAPAKLDRFRSWVTDRDSGYERLTDEIARQLVLKFGERPTPETIALLKDAGFRYQPEYFGQQKVWTRRNDFEGRLQLQQIEAQVRGPSAEPETSR